MHKPSFIHQPAGLDALAKTLLAESCIAVDTESNSLYAYREQVCLIQFSTRERDYLVDPLALDDLSPLREVFCNPGVEKVFHAAEYDLICLRRDFGFEFAHIFDTMVAGRILGRDEVGLGAMLLKEFDVQVDKRHQRANWGQRPLPDYLLDYAQYDTHFLIQLRERLSRELEEMGRLDAGAGRLRAAVPCRQPEPREPEQRVLADQRGAGPAAAQPGGAGRVVPLPGPDGKGDEPTAVQGDRRPDAAGDCGVEPDEPGAARTYPGDEPLADREARAGAADSGAARDEGGAGVPAAPPAPG